MMSPINETGNFYYDKFPENFKWGSSSSACQVEGGWNLDGKGSSWWDVLTTKNPEAIVDESRARITADSYYRFEEDVMRLVALKATSYKLSISWSRILPDGTLSKVNKSGLDYYDDLINTLLENGIEPIVVLYHWDLPQALFQKYPKSWLDENVIKAFGHYAQLCFKKFGDRVKHWVTIHDPWTHSVNSYGTGIHPPCLQQWENGTPYKVYRKLLKAHALAYKIYDKGFKSKQNGKVGISLNSKCLSSTNFISTKSIDTVSDLSSSDEEISSNPNSESERNYKNNKNQCTSENWLLFEVSKNPFDFVDFNDEVPPSLTTNSNSLHSSEMDFDTQKEIQNMCNNHNLPRNALNVIKIELGNPEVLVSGKGVPLKGKEIKTLTDLERIEYFQAYANEVLKCVVLDGCNIIGYLPGTLVDSWEWENGFTISYGLHQVNFNNPEKPRVQRSSAKYLKHLFQNNGFSKEWDIGSIPLNPNL